MVYTGVLRLEEKLAREEKKFTSAVKDFFLDTFSHERYLLREMQDHTSHGRFEQAADYAIQLKQYDYAFTLYNQAVAKGNWRANIPAAELAESLRNYEQGLRYRLQGDDYVHAAINAGHLGRHDEANRYLKKLHEV